jgi:hypothetical protein
MKISKIYSLVRRLRTKGYTDNQIIKYLRKHYNIEL